MWIGEGVGYIGESIGSAFRSQTVRKVFIKSRGVTYHETDSDALRADWEALEKDIDKVFDDFGKLSNNLSDMISKHLKDD